MWAKGRLQGCEEEMWHGGIALAEEVQDVESRQVIVGMDVESLYPSMKLEEIKHIIWEEVARSPIKWEEIDYIEAVRYLAKL